MPTSFSHHSVSTCYLEKLRYLVRGDRWRIFIDSSQTILPSTFLRTMCRLGCENVVDNTQLSVWGGGVKTGHYHVIIKLLSTGWMERHLYHLKLQYFQKAKKILQISKAWKVLEGILINVHEVVGLLNSSAKRK